MHQFESADPVDIPCGMSMSHEGAAGDLPETHRKLAGNQLE